MVHFCSPSLQTDVPHQQHLGDFFLYILILIFYSPWSISAPPPPPPPPPPLPPPPPPPTDGCFRPSTSRLAGWWKLTPSTSCQYDDFCVCVDFYFLIRQDDFYSPRSISAPPPPSLQTDVPDHQGGGERTGAPRQVHPVNTMIFIVYYFYNYYF